MKDTTTSITLIRHGHVYNPENIVYGRLPGFGLSTAGRHQAGTAADALSSADLTTLYASPQQRAQETATILLRFHPNLQIITTPMIDEIACYFEGHPVSEVEARGWDLYTGITGDYETPPEIAARAGRFIQETRLAHPGKHVAAVTHGDVIAFAVLAAMQQPVEVTRKRTLDRFGITDCYPATASLTTLIYRTNDCAEIPEIRYSRPYGDELALTTLS